MASDQDEETWVWLFSMARRGLDAERDAGRMNDAEHWLAQVRLGAVAHKLAIVRHALEQLLAHVEAGVEGIGASDEPDALDEAVAYARSVLGKSDG